MNSILPKGKQIRIRSFYGFGPEEDGYVGWTQESSRDAYLRKLNDGDLVMIYGASTAETEKSLLRLKFQMQHSEPFGHRML